MRILNWLFSGRHRRLIRVQAERRRRNAERFERQQAELRAKLMDLYIHASTYRDARRLLELMRTRY